MKTILMLCSFVFIAQFAAADNYDNSEFSADWIQQIAATTTGYKTCHGPTDCSSTEVCWTVGCIPARCSNDNDCALNAPCTRDGFCSYGE